jgi:hypothetical protein
VLDHLQHRDHLSRTGLNATPAAHRGEVFRVTRVRRPPRATRAAVTLAVASAGFLMVSLDVTIVSVALPTLAEQLGASLEGLQWIVDGYALTFAAVQITGGALSDTLGTRGSSSVCSSNRRGASHRYWPASRSCR